MTCGADNVVYMSDVRRQLEGKEMTDVEVVCEDGTLTCHAVMLAAASKWWTQVYHVVASVVVPLRLTYSIHGSRSRICGSNRIRMKSSSR